VFQGKGAAYQNLIFGEVLYRGKGSAYQLAITSCPHRKIKAWLPTLEDGSDFEFVCNQADCFFAPKNTPYIPS
jgi:hypothetical protein